MNATSDGPCPHCRPSRGSHLPAARRTTAANGTLAACRIPMLSTSSPQSRSASSPTAQLQVRCSLRLPGTMLIPRDAAMAVCLAVGVP